jgi:hypothetical protein
MAGRVDLGPDALYAKGKVCFLGALAFTVWQLSDDGGVWRGQAAIFPSCVDA